MKLTKKDYFKIIPIILVIFFISLTWSLNQRNDNIIATELVNLNNNLEKQAETLEMLQTAQRILILDLRYNLKNHNSRIDVNFKNMNNLTSELINLKIEQDELSEQSILYLFDEVYKEIELIRKKVK